MLIRILDGCKLLAWGLVAGSCLVAAIISHRAPKSIWTSAITAQDLYTTSTRETDLFHAAAWCGDADHNSGKGNCQQNTRFTEVDHGDFVACQATLNEDNDQATEATCDVPCETPFETPSTCSKPLPVDVASVADSKCESVTGSQVEDLASGFVARAPIFDDEIRQVHVEQCQARTESLDTTSTGEPQCSEQASTTTDCREACEIQKLESCPPTDIAERQVTLRDAATNETVATLTIAGSIESSSLPAEEIELAQDERIKNMANRSSPEHTAKVNAYRDETTGQFTIEAQTIEITELARYFARDFGLPIECHGSAVGTVSANVTDVTLIRAIQKLVEPFGFVVVEYGPKIVIGQLQALEHTARREATAYASQIPVAAMAKRLPMVSQVSAASHNVPSSAIAPQGNPEEIAIGIQAKTLVSEGRLAETTDLLIHAVSIYPDSAVFYRMLAEVYFHRNELPAAEAAAQQSLTIDKSNPLANRVYGEILQRSGRKDRAQHYFQQAKYLGYKRSLN